MFSSLQGKNNTRGQIDCSFCHISDPYHESHKLKIGIACNLNNILSGAANRTSNALHKISKFTDFEFAALH